MTDKFITKDSGKRENFSTGMCRDTQEGKLRFDLLWLPILIRDAELMARGAIKYGENNWQKARTKKELRRAYASLLRHVYQLINGDEDEDHAAGARFNVALVESIKTKLRRRK